MKKTVLIVTAVVLAILAFVLFKVKKNQEMAMQTEVAPVADTTEAAPVASNEAAPVAATTEAAPANAAK